MNQFNETLLRTSMKTGGIFYMKEKRSGRCIGIKRHRKVIPDLNPLVETIQNVDDTYLGFKPRTIALYCYRAANGPATCGRSKHHPICAYSCHLPDALKSSFQAIERHFGQTRWTTS